MLLTGRAFIEAARALAVWTALQMDIAARHPDADTRREADALVALLTPVVKAAFTDFGFETAVASQQVFGGHGYIREWGMEQYVRDARIAQIYEGTNGVQAMDLVTRKLGLDGGRLVRRFFAHRPGRPRCRASRSPARRWCRRSPRRWRGSRPRRSVWPGPRRSRPVPPPPTICACSRLSPSAGCGRAWPPPRPALGEAATPVERRKTVLARFFVERMLPQTLALSAALAADAGANNGAPARGSLAVSTARAYRRRSLAARQQLAIRSDCARRKIKANGAWSRRRQDH